MNDAVQPADEETDENDASPEGRFAGKCHGLVFENQFNCPADKSEKEIEIELPEGENGWIGTDREIACRQDVDGEKDVCDDKKKDVHFQQAAGVAVHHEEDADEHDGYADKAVFVWFLFEKQIGEGGTKTK